MERHGRQNLTVAEVEEKELVTKKALAKGGDPVEMIVEKGLLETASLGASKFYYLNQTKSANFLNEIELRGVVVLILVFWRNRFRGLYVIIPFQFLTLDD